MRSSVLIVLCALFVTANGDDEDLIRYDATAAKRFEEELARLGVNLGSISYPDVVVEPPPPVVSAPAGDFEGYWMTSVYGRPIAAFEGIPYVEPPVGHLRFKVAKPLTSRLLSFKAKKPGSKCSQRDVFGGATHGQIIGQEDCLFANIYVPEGTNRSETDRLPVLFYVYGGGFINREGDMGQSNILLDKDVIYFTFNYRIGPLGFMGTEDGVIPGNLGLKDMVAALEWVQKNIAAFGGDASRVTVMGHSSGAASAEHLMLSPLTKGLMHGVISISGSAMGPYAVSPPGSNELNRKIAANHWSCPEPSEEFLKCLRSKTAEEIIGVDEAFSSPVFGGIAISFKPVVEGNIPGALLPDSPSKLLALNNNIPLLTGLTSGEGCFFAIDLFSNKELLSLLDEDFTLLAPFLFLSHLPETQLKNAFDSFRRTYFSSGPLRRQQIVEAANLFTDVFFLWPTIKGQFYRRNGEETAPSYVYFFSHEGSRSVVRREGRMGRYGVCHCDDLFYIFPKSEKIDLKPVPSDVLMSMIMTDIFTSFARDGVPSSRFLQTEWRPVTTKGTDIEYLHIRAPLDIRMEKDLLPERWTLVEKLLQDSQDSFHNEL